MTYYSVLPAEYEETRATPQQYAWPLAHVTTTGYDHATSAPPPGTTHDTTTSTVAAAAKLVAGECHSLVAALCDELEEARSRVGVLERALHRANQRAVRSIHWSPYDRVRVVNADP